MLPYKFAPKQLAFVSDTVITTRYKRPGDGIKSRLQKGWYALGQDRSTRASLKEDHIRRDRGLDFQRWEVPDGIVIRLNNRDEFCAWVKQDWIDEVRFEDLGFTAGKDDCPEPLENYLRRQHPANDEHLMAERLALTGDPLAGTGYDPFAGRPADAMYGDFFDLELWAEEEVGQEDGRVRWERLHGGQGALGGGRIRFHLKVGSKDILPLSIVGVHMVVDHHAKGSRDDEERLGVFALPDPTVLPIMISPGEVFRHVFKDHPMMRDLYDRVVRIKIVVSYEDPWGEIRHQDVETWYYKVYCWRG